MRGMRRATARLVGTVVVLAAAAVPRGAHPERGVNVPSALGGRDAGAVARAGATAESGKAGRGFRCNIEKIGHAGIAGGYKVERYVDNAGHECAYYDTTLLFPKQRRDRQ